MMMYKKSVVLNIFYSIPIPVTFMEEVPNFQCVSETEHLCLKTPIKILAQSCRIEF